MGLRYKAGGLSHSLPQLSRATTQLPAVVPRHVRPQAADFFYRALSPRNLRFCPGSRRLLAQRHCPGPRHLRYSVGA